MLNQVNIMGRACAKPELKYTQSGLPVTSFRLAVDRNYLTNGEREADFLTVVAWRGTAEFICRYFGKGQMLAINGRLQVRPWTDRDGNKREAVEIVAESAYFCGSRMSGPEAGTQREQGPMNEDALPDMAA